MKQLILVFGLVLYGGCLMSQPWLSGLNKHKSQLENLNFYEVQNAFNNYWDGKKVTKGKGYKQFKRWEAFMLPRIYPTGHFLANQSWLEFQKIKDKSLKSTVSSDWKPIGPFLVPDDNFNKPSGVGRVNCIAFHPTNANILFVGTPSGGFWKSQNGGATWSTTTDELGTLGVSDIAINPNNPDIVYIATGDGDAGDTYSIGVLMSANGGESWMQTGLSTGLEENLIIRRLIINPNTPEVLIAATSFGIYRTADGGISWTNVLPGHFKDLEFNPTNPEIVYAARYGSNNSRFYKSVDGGENFTEIKTGVDLSKTYRLELAVGSSSSSEVIYALYSEREQDGFHSLWKSINAGDNWVKVYDAVSGKNLLGWKSDGSDTGGQGWYDLSLAVSPSNEEVVYVGGVNIWKTVNSGSDWVLVGDWEGKAAAYVHADHHCLAFSPSAVLYNGNDGGIYKTSNGGLTWTDLSNGLNILQIDRIGTSQADPTIVIAGNQDNGTMKYNATTDSWKQIYRGDGAECFVDKYDNNTVYISPVNGDFQRSFDGGETFTSIKPLSVNKGAWHTPFVINPENSNVLYAGFNDVWKSLDKGKSWERISIDLSVNQSLTQLALAPSNTNYIYTTTGTKHWRTKNGGLTWVELKSEDLPDLYLKYFAVSDNNPEVVWAVFSGFSEGQKVYFSQNSGDTWQNISNGLPNVPVNCIVRERQSNDVLYLGTDIGVFYRDASKDSWEVFNTGLPNVVISELEIQYSGGLLRAGTRGRGLWETTINLSNPEAPAVESAEIIDEGNKITLIFNRPMIDPVGKQNEFIINSGGAEIIPVSVELKEGTDNVYIISLPVNINEGEIVTISYIGDEIYSAEGQRLAAFVNKGVNNNLGSYFTNIKMQPELMVYPNPNNGFFDIEFVNVTKSTLEIKLLNMQGQVVFTKSMAVNPLENKVNLFVPENLKGVYFLLIDADSRKYQQTVIIQ